MLEIVTALGFIGAAAAAASTGAMFPPGKWYDALSKPRWTPPNWLFPLAWTALYIAMVYAAWRVAFTPSPGPALALWACQIALNGLWSPVFFGLQRIGGALAAIGPLWLSVVGTTILFFQADQVAGLLLLPYVVWVSYAAALNYDIWRRNRTAS
ncbi:MAG: TspO/MBR family protein [Pseudomonadota bacterium]